MCKKRLAQRCTVCSLLTMNSKATRQFKNELRALRTDNEITIHAKYLAGEYPQFVREVNTALLAITTERLLAK